MSNSGQNAGQITGQNVSKIEIIEEVPPWWTRASDIPWRMALFALLCTIGGAATATVDLFKFGGLALLTLVGIGIIGFFRSNRFPMTISVAEDGTVTINRAYARRYAKTIYVPVRFDAAAVASVERINYANEHPGTASAMQSGGHRDAGRVHDFELVKIILNDGQETDVAWQVGVNAAANLQSAVRTLLLDAQGAVQAQQAHQQRVAALAPGDEPL